MVDDSVGSVQPMASLVARLGFRPGSAVCLEEECDAPSEHSRDQDAIVPSKD